ncbi:unnamed protein product, partial [Allacma fusca]
WIWFFLIMNLAVGGTNSYFQDNLLNSKKPWTNSSPQAALDFWNSHSDWPPLLGRRKCCPPG